MHPVIDVHTHMYTREWLDLLRLHGGPDLTVAASLDSPETVFYKGASFCVLEAPHFDFDLRIRNMNEAGVDIAIITVSCPSVFWGDADSSSRAACRCWSIPATRPARMRWNSPSTP